MATRRGFDHTVRVAVLEGGPPATTLAGGEAIGPDDVLVNVHHLSADLTTVNEGVLGSASIVGPGQLQLDDGAGGPDTTGNFVLVMWVTG